MKNTRNTRVFGIALAAAVAGTFALTPVHSQAAVKPNDIARGLNSLNSVLDKNLDKVGAAVSSKVRPGSGSKDARYSSGGWTYTAVAYYPAADRVYAISTGEDGKPAGHLLRIKTNMDELADLGPLDLRGINTKDVTSASITPAGVLVLFAGSEFRAIDLSKDDLSKSVFSERISDASALAVKTGKLTTSGVAQVGTPSAWASGVDPSKTNELYAVSGDFADLTLWTMDVASGSVAVEPLKVNPGVVVDGIGELNYAYTKSNGTFVFADDNAKSIEVRDGQVVASYFGNTAADNFRELAYLPAGAGYRPVTQFVKPDPLPGVFAPNAVQPKPNTADVVRDLQKIGDAANAVASAADKASGTSTTTTTTAATVVTESTEPTPTDAVSGTATVLADNDVTATETTATTTETTAAGATLSSDEDRDVLFTVMSESGHAVRDAEIVIAGSGITGKTDKNGQESLTLPAEDAVVYVGDRPYVVDADQTRMRITLLADTAAGSTGTPTDTSGTGEAAADSTGEAAADGTGEAAADGTGTPADTSQGDAALKPEIKLFVFDENGRAIPGAKVTTDNNPVVLESNSSGVVSISRELVGESRKFFVSYGSKSVAISLDTKSQNLVEVEMPVVYTAPNSPNRQPTTGREERKTVTIGVKVETESGDPVQYAEVYSVHGLAIKVDGLTDANGLVYVTIPGDEGNGDEVTLGVRSAPSGYKTTTKNVSRKSDGATIKLPKSSTTTTTTKNTPEQILDVIKQVEPLVAALGGSAAIGAGLSARGTGTTTARSTTTTTARATSLSGTVSTGRTTSVAETAKATSRRASASGSGSNSGSTSKSTTTRTTTTSSSRDGDLADTGTPMTTVIVLGVLALLIGGAYVAMGRRRDS